MNRLRLALWITLLLTAVHLTGCDLGEPAPPAMSAVGPTSLAPATARPTGPVAPTVPGSPTATPLLALAGPALEALPSYQWTARWTLRASPGETVSPLSWRAEGTRVKEGNRWHITWAWGTGDVELEVIHIGDQEWVRFGDQWVETPPPQQLQFLRFTPRGWWDETALGLEGNVNPITPDEQVNGVLCRHYRTAASYQGVVISGGTGWSHRGDVWLAVEGGYPVRSRFLGTGAIQSVMWTLTQELDVTQVGDAANVVQPPP